MPAVSVTLDEVAGSCAGTGPNNGALLPTDQAAANRADYAANNGALCLAVVMSVGPSVRQTLLCKGQHNKNEHQQHSDESFPSCVVCLLHSHLLFFEGSVLKRGVTIRSRARISDHCA
jgi:hypothetical protein